MTGAEVDRVRREVPRAKICKVCGLNPVATKGIRMVPGIRGIVIRDIVIRGKGMEHMRDVAGVDVRKSGHHGFRFMWILFRRKSD
jgi:hypothetical protein